MDSKLSPAQTWPSTHLVVRAGGWLSSLAKRGGLYWLGANLVTAALYCTLGYAVSLFFAKYGLFPSPIWLPASIAVVAAMIGGIRMFPGIFLGSLIANYALFSPPFFEALIISITNAIGPIVGAAATRRFRPENGVFSRFSGIVAFIACNVLLHPAITATGGVFAIALYEPQSFASLSATWVSWWLSDSGGTLYFAPALLLWLGVEHELSPRTRDVDWGDLIVWSAVAATAVVLFATLPLMGAIRVAFPFLLVLPLSWIAIRMSLRAAYTLISLVAVVACGFTVAGYGPFQVEGFGNPLQFVGVLIVMLAINVLTIVALVSERRVAEETSKIKSMFLASTSHDLRTPLNAIIGFSDMIRRSVLGPIGNPRYAEYIEHIHDSGNLLLNITNDLLDISKIEAGRRDLAPTLLDGRAVLDGCVSIVAPRAMEKNIEISVEAASGTAVFADNTALRQILLNLLSNAVNFTPPDGHIAVRLAHEADGGTAIEVIDTGIGMDAEGIKMALEPFRRVEKSRPPQDPGTGLGLPIAHLLAELHGGRLTITSTPGNGTAVRVTFPPPH